MRNQEDNDDIMGATLEANRVQQELLRTALLRAMSNHHHHKDSGSSFPTTFEQELGRIAQFVQHQQVSLELVAKELFLRTDTLANNTLAPQQQHSHATLLDLKASTRKIVDDCIALQEFFTASRRTLLDTAVTADQKLAGTTTSTSTTCAKLVLKHLPKAHLNSSLVCVISDLYSALRVAEEKIVHQSHGGGDAVWEAPSSFKRTTTKYWIKDENLTKLMLVCTAEAPLLVYGKKGPLTSTQRSDLKLSEGDKLWDTLATRVNSIYFDSNDMSLYRERIKRSEGAQLLRARWYGTAMPTGDKILFLELKTHHEKWVAQKSIKERAEIQQGDMADFLAPVPWTRYDAEQVIVRAKPKLKDDEDKLAKQAGLLLRMHNLCVKHKLNSCVRTVYDRAAFQSSKSNDLRLTLDRNVTVVNERSQPIGVGRWCLTDAEARTARASVVPFNVFEVKLAGDDPMPPGLAQAERDSTMILAMKFSKFLTGAAAFNPVPVLPYWARDRAFYSFFELDKRAGQSPDSTHDASQGGDYKLMGSSNDSPCIIPKGVVIAPKYLARIEPKTYFANERTFVQWISASILLLSVSGFMLEAGSIGDFKLTAAVISFSALILLVYSTGLYFKRLALLADRKPYGYFNKVNPIFLTTIVFVAIFLVWADSVRGHDFLEMFSFSEKGDSGGRYLRSRWSGRFLQETYTTCPDEVIGTTLSIQEGVVSSLAVDVSRHSLLMTSGESVYMQPMGKDGPVVPPKEESLIRIHQSHLQGLAMVGDRLFAVSDGPQRTELMELAWWGSRGGTAKLRVVGRWTLEHSPSQIAGFSFVPSTDSNSTGTFYIHMNGSIHVYSVPAGSDQEESGQSAHPMRLKSLNMKVLTHGRTEGAKDRLSTMTTFEGVTYMLRSEQNMLEAWNLTDGTLLSEVELPTIGGGHFTDFAMERQMVENDGDVMEGVGGDSLTLHLMTDNRQIWSFPVLEDTGTPHALFSVPDCQNTVA